MGSIDSSTNKEDSFVKWGISFTVIVLLIAGSVFYDDVYNHGKMTTLKSKIEQLIGISSNKAKHPKRDSIK